MKNGFVFKNTFKKEENVFCPYNINIFTLFTTKIV